MIFEEITYSVIGAAMRVHNKLGCGFQEKIYQAALSIELGREGLPFEREWEMPIEYDNHTLGVRRVDFFIDESVMVEIKALTAIEKLHYAQIMNYCTVFNLPVGLLINFGTPRLLYKRIYNLNHPSNKDYQKRHT